MTIPKNNAKRRRLIVAADASLRKFRTELAASDPAPHVSGFAAFIDSLSARRASPAMRVSVANFIARIASLIPAGDRTAANIAGFVAGFVAGLRMAPSAVEGGAS